MRASRPSPVSSVTPDVGVSVPAAPVPASAAREAPASPEASASAAPATPPAPGSAGSRPASASARPGVGDGARDPDKRRSAPAAAVTLLSPVENATLDAREIAFNWEPFPGALRYEVEVMTEKGDVVWQHRTDATSAGLSSDRAPLPPARYFVKIRAYLAGGATVRSAAVSFRVGAW
jgi:hypothetical protein